MTAHPPGEPSALTGVALLDADGRVCSHDDGLAKLLGEAPQGTEFLRALPLNERTRRRVAQTFALALSHQETPPLHWRHQGSEHQLRFVSLHQESAAPQLAALLQVAPAQTRGKRRPSLNTLHALHEAVVTLLGEPDAHALIGSVCRVLVESSGYPLAWIGCVDNGRVGHMDSVAAAPGYLDDLTARDGKNALLSSPVKEALHTGRPAVHHQGDSGTAQPPPVDLTAAYGYNSIAAFPLPIENRIAGVMVVYSHRQRAFKGGEYEALRYLAEGLASGLARLEQHRVQQLAEDKLRQTTSLFEASHEGQLVTDEKNRIIAINPALSELTGYAESEVLGKRPSLFRSSHHDHAFYRAMWTAIESQGFWQGEIWNRSKDGSIKPYWLRIGRVPPSDGAPTRYVGTYTDITALKEIEARLEHLAHHDTLTNLPNRSLLENHLEQALKRAMRHNELVALLFLDLDDFKRINDSLGHGAGDRLLLSIAQRLRHAIREEDMLAHFGGDEFVILIERLRQPEQASLVARQLLKTVAQNLELDGEIVNLSASIGIAVAPGHGEEAHELIQNADSAMSRAKASGRNTYQYYSRELTVRTRRQLALENLLRNALERDEFHLRYQPLVDIRNGGIAGVEALLRWKRGDGESIPPDEFIPLAEERDLIVPIGSWVLDQACRQAVAWSKSDIGALRIAVNVSGRQLDRRSFAREIDDLLLRYQLKPDLLELEVTETLLMEHDGASGMFDYLGQLGLRLAIDDFGTGYSSLSRLSQLRPNTIKIDRSFVQAAPQQGDAAAITTAIIHMAHSLGMEVVAEGVETTAQLDFLRSRAVDLIQGYYFTPPLPTDELEDWVRRYRSGEAP